VWKADASFIIDSTLSQIWLRIEACAALEKTSGLVLNKTAQVYILGNAVHTSMRSSNEMGNFTIRESSTGSVTCQLPYKAFDLTASNETGNGTESHCFFFFFEVSFESIRICIGSDFLFLREFTSR
jgi:hypothetical protein